MGEPVEYTLTEDQRGRGRAERVTGPMGSFVQGAPRQQTHPSNERRGSFQEFGQRDRYEFRDESERGQLWADERALSGSDHSFEAGHGAPPNVDFHELDLPEDEIDDNSAAEAESTKRGGADASSPSKNFQD
jgi:hypothetical protein